MLMCMLCSFYSLGASSLIAAVFAQQQQQQQQSQHQAQENLTAIVEGASSNEAPVPKIKSEHSSSSMLLLQPQVSVETNFEVDSSPFHFNLQNSYNC